MLIRSIVLRRRSVRWPAARLHSRNLGHDVLRRDCKPEERQLRLPLGQGPLPGPQRRTSDGRLWQERRQVELQVRANDDEVESARCPRRLQQLDRLHGCAAKGHLCKQEDDERLSFFQAIPLVRL